MLLFLPTEASPMGLFLPTWLARCVHHITQHKAHNIHHITAHHRTDSPYSTENTSQNRTEQNKKAYTLKNSQDP